MRFKKYIKIMICFCLVFLIAGLFVFINLPNFVESQIQKRLPQFIDPKEVAFNVQTLGFSSAFVSQIRISKGVTIDSVGIDYDIQNLSSVHLAQVTVSGITLRADLDKDNQVTLQGISLPSPSSEPTIRPSKQPFLPFLPEKVILQNGKIILNAFNQEFLIPFDVVLHIRKTDEKMVIEAQLFPFGEKVGAVLSYDINKGIESVKINGSAFDLSHINPVISKINTTVQFKGPVDFSLESASPLKEWKLDLSQVQVASPITAAVRDITATVVMDERKLDARGTFTLFHSMLPENKMTYGVTFEPDNDFRFDARLESAKMGEAKISYESIHAVVTAPEVRVELSGTSKKSNGSITLNCKQAKINGQKESLGFDNAQIKADVAADFTGKGNGISSSLSLDMNNIAIQSDSTAAFFPTAGMSGVWFLNRDFRPSCAVTVKASKGTIASAEFKTHASGIGIEIPIQYPTVGKKISGKYAIPVISYHNKYTFNTSGGIIQTNTREFQVNGTVFLKMFPQITTQFNSTVGFEKEFQAAVDFKTNLFHLSYADIEKLSSQKIQTAEIDMMASAKGRAVYDRHQLKTSLQVNIKDGKVFMPDMNLTATGINTQVDLNDLLVPESVPGQVLTVTSVEINKIKIDDARIQFSIEDAKSLLIENMRFKWCNGRVSTESIRFPQENDAYALTLFCDRLELTDLLKQMGVFHAEGDGTLNGRIPVVYANGNISFNNGFLFSTPGSGGKVVIENTDKITAGIPMDTPQFAQLDLAREALKDFDYQWAKLTFNTFEDTLNVNMELDGKPSNLLPFEFKKEIGGFVRVGADSPGSHFQGIKLDVNLKLPFNEVMKFGNKLKSILN